MRDWHQSRRDLLKRLGLGAACLPLLRAHRGWATPPSPRRLVLIEMVHGLRQQYWKPAPGPLAGQTLPEISATFEPVEDAMIFLPDLTNPGRGYNGRYNFGVMFYGMGPATSTGAYKEPGGPTLDQVAAAGLMPMGARPSLGLGVQLDRAPSAGGTPGGSFCFWRGAGQPIQPQGDPAVVYRDLLTGPGGDLPTVKRLLARRKSILDYVGSNLEDFRARSGMEDRAAISAHLDSVRELEQQVMTQPQPAACAPDMPPSIDLSLAASYAPILDAHLRLIVGALRCGVTRVATLQTSDVFGFNIDFGSFVPGLPPRSTTGYKTPYRNWSDLAHNPVQGGVDHKRIVDRWFCERFTDALLRMKALDEGDGTLLDHTIVVIGNNMQDGANLDGQKVPWMIAGGGPWLNTGTCLPSAGHSTTSVMAGVCDALAIKHPYGAALPDLKRI